MKGSVSLRYARAIFAIAREQNVLEQVATDLDGLAALANHPSVTTVLRNPLLSDEKRKAFARLLADQVKPSELTAKFVDYVSDQQRLDQLPRIADFFQKLHDDHLGRVRARFRSAAKLTDAQLGELNETFQRLTGRTVDATALVDPDLIGGVVVEVGGKVYDGSVRSHFERIAKDLAGSAI